MIKPLIQKIREAGGSSESRTWFFFALGIGFLVDIGLYAFNLLVPNLTNWIAASVILLLPAIFVLIGFDRARQDDPIRNLFDQPNAVKASYLLACAAALQQKPDVSARDKREAIDELAREIRTLKNENQYIAAVINDVETHAVWAVCGKKAHPNANKFYKANKSSFENGNYIERVFLPPTTTAEAESIEEAIQHHFQLGILVRALTKDQDADEVRHSHSLPPGFGMTIVGACRRLAGNRQCDPDRKHAVLVHWGGLDYRAGTHYGVVLKHTAWLDYFWDLFEQVRGVTEIVNPDRDPPTWPQFIQGYPKYEP